MPKQRVYMMIGLPGAGKDTWIKKTFGEYEYVVSRDVIRAELGMCGQDDKIAGDNRQEKLVTEEFNKKLIQYVKEGKDVIINNTNLKRKYRNAFKTLLKDFDIEWVYVVIKAPSIEENIRRRKSQIPGDVIRRMNDGFQYPDENEYDDIVVIQQ